jgi:hypothetical protein
MWFTLKITQKSNEWHTNQKHSNQIALNFFFSSPFIPFYFSMEFLFLFLPFFIEQRLYHVLIHVYNIQFPFLSRVFVLKRVDQDFCICFGYVFLWVLYLYCRWNFRYFYWVYVTISALMMNWPHFTLFEWHSTIKLILIRLSRWPIGMHSNNPIIIQYN